MSKAHPTFLILDDNEDNRFLERRALQKEFPDCRVIECSSVAEALAAARRDQFDGIVTDHHLGDSDGAEFVHHVRAAGISCPVVMVTGTSNPKIIERALLAGVAWVFSGSDSNFVGYFRKALEAEPNERVSAQSSGGVSQPAAGWVRVAKILVIEDDDLLRTTLRTALSGQGHDVLEAHDGREGIELCAVDPPDLVITDLIMPNQEGLETIVTLQRDYPDVKIVAMSGGGTNPAGAYLKLAQKLGAFAMLAKPFSKDELNTVVAMALSEVKPANRSN